MFLDGSEQRPESPDPDLGAVPGCSGVVRLVAGRACGPSERGGQFRAEF